MKDKIIPSLKPTKKQLKQYWRSFYKDVCTWAEFYEACWDFEVSLSECMDVESRLHFVNPDKHDWDPGYKR